MSHAQPGYVLSRQVPPTESACSRMMKSFQPARLRRIAMPIPPKPAPTMAIAFLATLALVRVTGNSTRAPERFVDTPRSRAAQLCILLASERDVHPARSEGQPNPLSRRDAINHNPVLVAQ